MKAGRFDERCPHCLEKVDYYDHFVAHDYKNEFVTECPWPGCEESITVVVHAVPEFEAFKKGEA